MRVRIQNPLRVIKAIVAVTNLGGAQRAIFQEVEQLYAFLKVLVN